MSERPGEHGDWLETSPEAVFIEQVERFKSVLQP